MYGWANKGTQAVCRGGPRAVQNSWQTCEEGEAPRSMGWGFRPEVAGSQEGSQVERGPALRCARIAATQVWQRSLRNVSLGEEDVPRKPPHLFSYRDLTGA